jgi:hypothetical protein
VSIDRNELERLLADRPTGQRSAMQAVRDSYDDITLMRERGLSWAEISGMLAKLGVTARDNQPIAPVTLRSAYFLVGNEDRGELPPADPAMRATLEALLAGESATESQAEPELEPEPVLKPEPEPETESVFEPEPETEPEAPPAAMTEKAPVKEPPPAPSPPPPAPAFIPQPIAVKPAVAAPAPSLLTQPTDDANTNARDHRMLGTIFVLNDRGGVGKTLLSHHLMATAMLEGLQLRVVEYEVNERLARLFGPDVVEHRRISQDFMNLMGSGDGFYEFWDQIGPELQRGGRLFDFGGNISQWFFNWAEVSGFDYYVGEGERLTFMVPVTVDLASLSTGMATLDRITAIAPKARRVLVENGVSGPFSQLEDSQYARRKAELVEREGVEVISMPPCTAPAWARLTGHRIDQVAQMTREDLAKLGMTPPVASRSLIIIHEWLRGMRNALAPYVLDALRPSLTPPSGRVAR